MNAQREQDGTAATEPFRVVVTTYVEAASFSGGQPFARTRPE
jgi:hypothetical protein